MDRSQPRHPDHLVIRPALGLPRGLWEHRFRLRTEPHRPALTCRDSERSWASMMTGGIMTAAAAYLWKRRRKTEGAKTAVMLFTLVLSISHHSQRFTRTYMAGVPSHLAANRTNSDPDVHQLGTPETGTTRRNTSRHQEHLQQYLRPARPEQKSATTLTNHTTGGLCRHPKHHQEVN